MRVALRIEVGTVKGASEGVPALLRLLDEHQVKATFFFSLGPDYSGYPFAEQMPRIIRKRLPAPRISRRCRENLLSVADAGHEIGISSYTVADWWSDVAFQTADWTYEELAMACEVFTDLFGKAPHCFAAMGWQVNPHLFSEEQELGFDFASDVRGQHIFLPESQGVSSSCPQIPTTLPTLDELLAQDGVDEENLHQFLYAACQRIMPNGEVFSLSAEREGLDLLDVFERLLIMWKGGQWEIRSLGELYNSVIDAPLKRHLVGWGTVYGRSEHVAMQSTPK